MVSAIFFVAGLLLTLAAKHVVPDLLHMNHAVLLLGFVLFLLAPIVLISTFLLSNFPGTTGDDECEH